MPKELTEKQKEFIKKTAAHNKEQVEELAYAALVSALKSDIAVNDLPYYVLSRARAIINDAQEKTTFGNPKLRDAQKAFLKEYLAELKKNIIVPEKKEEKDATDERDNRCEPVAQKIVELILNEDLVFSDDYFFDMVLREEATVPLFSSISGYLDALDEKMIMITSEHWRRALAKLFGREREDVTFEDLKLILGE